MTEIEALLSSAEDPAALYELAMRQLSRKHLLHFIKRFHNDYMPGWVHKEICTKLENFIDKVIRKESPRLLIAMPPRAGKLVADSTPVFTTDGWRTHGDLQPGDYVFGLNGQPVLVLACSEPGEASLEVKTAGGASIKVHPNHEWTVLDRAGRTARTLETSEIMRNLFVADGPNKKRARFRIPTPAPLQYPAAKLPLDPYFFGVWLNNGDDALPDDHYEDRDRALRPVIEALGIETASVTRHFGLGVDYIELPTRIQDQLKALKVFGDKHIPELYLRSSLSQRMRLFAGILDAAGSYGETHRRVYMTVYPPRLRKNLEELALGIGASPRWSLYQQPKTASVLHTFTATLPPDLPVKNPRFTNLRASKYDRNDGIISVMPCPPESGKCIQVDAADGLYLVGERLTPTHNSLICSQYFPAWALGNYPGSEFISCSYALSLQSGFSRKVRGLLQDPVFRATFPQCELSPDAQNIEGWLTTAGGGFKPAGRGGPVSGFGASVLVLDDLLKNSAEAESATLRDSAWDWYTSTARTRLAPGGGILAVGTRWHHDDPMGRLEAGSTDFGDVFDVVRYPAIATHDEPHRKAGEALHPERYDVKELRAIQASVGPDVWEALYQQNPTPDTGGYFDLSFFRYFSETPPLLRTFAAFDLAIGKKERSDYTVGVVGGLDVEGNLYLLDLIRDRLDSTQIVDAIFAMHAKHKTFLLGIEHGQLGMAISPLINARCMAERIYDLSVKDLMPGRSDKESRARTLQGMIRQGRVRFPEFADWMGELKTEFAQFPSGKHDDQVDALAYLALMVAEIPAPRPAAEYAQPAWLAKLKSISTPDKPTFMAA